MYKAYRSKHVEGVKETNQFLNIKRSMKPNLQEQMRHAINQKNTQGKNDILPKLFRNPHVN